MAKNEINENKSAAKINKNGISSALGALHEIVAARETACEMAAAAKWRRK
jgi:hypothetical protein